MTASRLPLFGLSVLLVACGGPPDCTDPDTVAAIRQQLINATATAMVTPAKPGSHAPNMKSPVQQLTDAGRHALDVKLETEWRNRWWERYCELQGKVVDTSSTRKSACRKPEAHDKQAKANRRARDRQADDEHWEISPTGLLAYLMKDSSQHVSLDAVETERHDARAGSYTCKGTLSITPPEPVAGQLKQPAGRAGLHAEAPQALVWPPETAPSSPNSPLAGSYFQPPVGLLANSLHYYDPNAFTIERLTARQKTQTPEPAHPALLLSDGDIYSTITYVSRINAKKKDVVEVHGLEPLTAALKAISDPKSFKLAVDAARKAAADAARSKAVQEAWRQAEKARGLHSPLPWTLPPTPPTDRHTAVGDASNAPYPAQTIRPKPDQVTRIPSVSPHLPLHNEPPQSLGVAPGWPSITGAHSKPFSCSDEDSICLQLQADRLLALEKRLYERAFFGTADATRHAEMARTEKAFGANRERTCAHSADRADKLKCEARVTRKRIRQLYGNPDTG